MKKIPHSAMGGVGMATFNKFMTVNFWQQLERPIFCLAPMEEVTDAAFREMFARYSKISSTSPALSGTLPKLGEGNIENAFVMFTEFINVDGLLHPEGYEKLKIDLEFTEIQRPIVAQLWGANPEKFEAAAKLTAEKGFDGVDINMGCPQDKEIGIGACAALIKNPALAKEIIIATKKGAESAGRRIPVSVKTRLGYSSVNEMEEWIGFLLERNLSAITIHARTKQEKSKAPAHWEKIKEAVDIRNAEFKMRNSECKTLIIGNGDIKSREEGLKRVAETGCDGVMVGRGAFGNPWFFRKFGGENPNEVFPLQPSPSAPVSPFQGLVGREINSLADNLSYHPSVKERLDVMLEHAGLFNKLLGRQKSFIIMRKHFKAYASGFKGCHELRAKLLQTKSLDEARQITEKFLKSNATVS